MVLIRISPRDLMRAIELINNNLESKVSIKSFKPALLSLVIASAISANAFADEVAKESSVDEQFTIFGSDTSVNNIPGSAHQLTQDDLEKI